MCSVHLKMFFYAVLMNVLEWVLWKIGIPSVLDISVMSVNEGSNAGVRVDCKLSKEFAIKV